MASEVQSLLYLIKRSLFIIDFHLIPNLIGQYFTILRNLPSQIIHKFIQTNRSCAFIIKEFKDAIALGMSDIDSLLSDNFFKLLEIKDIILVSVSSF